MLVDGGGKGVDEEGEVVARGRQGRRRCDTCGCGGETRRGPYKEGTVLGTLGVRVWWSGEFLVDKNREVLYHRETTCKTS